MSPSKIQLRDLLLKTYPATGAEKLYAAAMCGEILVNGERLRNPKQLVPVTAECRWIREKYVGRGGLKLEGALEDFGLNPAGLVCLDAGASTGGFTDCLLAGGAGQVHAVDVGYNQLAWKLRSDSRVIVRERTNLMHLKRSDLHPPPTLAVADLSFRSLRGAASHLLKLTDGGTVLVLFKPQFEHPPEEHFDGVVRTRDGRSAVLYLLQKHLQTEGVYIHDAASSRISGRKGNREIFLLLSLMQAADPAYVGKRLELSLDAPV